MLARSTSQLLQGRWVGRTAAAVRDQFCRPMHTTLVQVYCKPGSAERVIAATLDNCAASKKEAGCLRFDLFRSGTDPDHLIIEEMYSTPADAAAHKVP